MTSLPPSAPTTALPFTAAAQATGAAPASSAGSSAAESVAPPISRFPGLDWLRALASILVVVLHAGMPYMTSPMPGLIWCTEDRPSRTPVVDALGWGIDTFVMPLFFLMGGFLACQSCGKAGPWKFFKNRTARLGLPFVAAFVLIMPADLYVWLLGWVCEDRIIPRKLRSLKVDGELAAQLMGPGHLWFLQYLWLFCAGGALLAHLWNRSREMIRPAAAVEPPESRPTIPFPGVPKFQGGHLAAIVSLFLMSVAGLYWKPLVVIGFQQAIAPQLPNVLYYVPCFALGWCLQHWQWKPVRWSAPCLIAMSLAIFPNVWQRIAHHVQTPLAGADRLQLVATFTLCGWLAATGLFAWALRSSRSAPNWIDYLSRASLWIYLAHHPVVALTQISLRLTEGSGIWKCAVATITGLVFCLLTYEAAIRGRWLDTILNGAKPTRSEIPTALPATRAA